MSMSFVVKCCFWFNLTARLVCIFKFFDQLSQLLWGFYYILFYIPYSISSLLKRCVLWRADKWPLSRDLILPSGPAIWLHIRLSGELSNELFNPFNNNNKKDYKTHSFYLCMIYYFWWLEKLLCALTPFQIFFFICY